MSDEREPPQEDLAKRKELEARFEDLFRRHYKDTVAHLVHHGFDRELSRELAQDAFIRVFHNMDAFRGGAVETERAYIFATARNLGRNAIRDGKTKKRAAEVISLAALPAPENIEAQHIFTGRSPSSGEDLARRRETFQRLADAIDELPENLRAPLLLRIAGHTYNDIARALDLSVHTVKGYLKEARKRLRKMLAEEPTGIEWPEDPPEDTP